MADVFLGGVEEGHVFLVVGQGHQELGLQVGLIEAREGATGVGWLEMRSSKGPATNVYDVTYVRILEWEKNVCSYLVWPSLSLYFER